MAAQYEERPGTATKFERAGASNLLANQTMRTTPHPSRLFSTASHYFVRSLVATADFMIDQAGKTIRRPTRIFYIPFNYLVLSLIGLLYCSRAPTLLFKILPKNEAMRQLRIEYYFRSGSRRLQEDRPSEAWEWNKQCLQESKEWSHFFAGAVGLCQGLGRYREALTLLAHSNQLRWQEACNLGVADCRYRLIDQFWVTNIGHTATLDYVIKLGILEGRSRDDTVLFVPPETSIANRCLVEQWRPHLRLVERAEDLPFRADAVSALRFDYLAPRLDDGSTTYFWELAARTCRRWHAEERPPLLALPPDIEERGRRSLRSKGIPDDAWFVGLHVREAGSKRHHTALHQILNANILSYLPAIADITKRGGWVIRMGDPSMVPLPSLPNVLDYCHSDLRSDWMDVFIAARCRFFVGTSSGPAYLPPLYGVPSVLTNWWPPAQRPWHPTDIFIPKLVRRMDGGEPLTLGETLAEPVSYCNSLTYLRQAPRVCVEDNDAEDIRAAVVEMFGRLDGSAGYDAEDTALRNRADRIYGFHEAFGMAQLARDFVRRHKSFVVSTSVA